MSGQENQKALTLGQKLADKCSNIIGSWKFIGIQTSFLTFWILLNIFSPKKPDPYPFILLNLMLSFQAAYTGPVLLMAGNRQSEIDRKRAIENLELDHTDHTHLIHLTEHINKHFHDLNQRIDKLEEKKPNKFIF
jgi:uncharacterized membrane protein